MRDDKEPKKKINSKMAQYHKIGYLRAEKRISLRYSRQTWHTEGKHVRDLQR